MTSDELTYRRVHHAPPELLFDCMTQPRHLAAFWGPDGTTAPCWPCARRRPACR